MAKKKPKTCRYKTEPMYSLDIKRPGKPWESRIESFNRKKMNEVLAFHRETAPKELGWKFRVTKIKDKKVCK